MPELDAKNEELEPSTSSALDEAVEQDEDLRPDDADSSPATGEESSEAETLSVVRDVVGDEEEAPAEEQASPAEGEEAGPEAGDDAPEAKEQDDEDYTDVPFHKHPRFQQLLRKAKTHEEDAKRYQNVQSFIDQHGLQADEAAELLVIGGDRKSTRLNSSHVAMSYAVFCLN